MAIRLVRESFLPPSYLFHRVFDGSMGMGLVYAAYTRAYEYFHVENVAILRAAASNLFVLFALEKARP